MLNFEKSREAVPMERPLVTTLTLKSAGKLRGAFG